jgi:hypothetical protein
MIREEINERILTVLTCLQFCADQRIFTMGERICINQGRARLMHKRLFELLNKAVPEHRGQNKGVVLIVGLYYTHSPRPKDDNEKQY